MIAVPSRPAAIRIGSLILFTVSGILLATACFLYCSSGAALFPLLRIWLIGTVGIYIPGTLLDSLFRTSVAGAQRFVLRCVFGSTCFTLMTVLSGLSGLRFLLPVYLLVSFLVWSLLWIRRLWKGQCPPRLPAAVPQLVLLCAVYILLNALWSVRYTHPAVAESIIPSQDFFWNLGNTQSLLQGFPPQDLRVSGVTVTYHYLTELLQAGMILAAGTPAYDTVAFAAYAPVAAGMTGCLYALGVRLWGEKSRRATALAGAPLWLCCVSLWKALGGGGSRFGNMLFIHTASNINGQATALAFLAAFFALFFAAETNGRNPQTIIGCILSFFLLTFSKGPQAALIALALTVALVFRLLIVAVCRFYKKSFTPFVKGNLWLYLAVCIGFWLVYGGLFSAGAGSSMAFSLTGTLKLHFFGSILNAGQNILGSRWPVLLPLLWAAQSFCIAPAACVAYLFGALRDIRRPAAISLPQLTLYAVVPGGLLAFFLFDHYSSSQIYFATVAVFALGVVLLQELPTLQKHRSILGRLLCFGVAALLAAGTLTGVFHTASFVSNAAAIRTGITEEKHKLPLTADEEIGCLWLAENMSANELFATNRMHTGQALEGLSNVYSGLSGRQAYCESIKYALSNMGDQTGDIMERYYLMEELFLPETSPERVREICAQCGIAYLLYHPASPGTNTHLQEFEAVYVSPALTIYKVN